MKVTAAVVVTIGLILTAAFLSFPRTAKERRPANLGVAVAKKERRLVLYSGKKAIRTYRIGLGFNPAGPKTKEGDGRTPEGDYYICSKNRQSRFYLSVGLSYPNVTDAERGLREGLITKAQYEKIGHAIRKRRKPPWDTPLGGEIFIHGNGSKTDWTLGCIALEDKDIRELYDLVSVGTPVTIRP